MMTEEEQLDMEKRFTKVEEEGLKNGLKHFDRIHDKLFSFNNIIIAGCLALSKIWNSVPLTLVLVPLSNFCLLIFIEHQMLLKSMFESNFKSKSNDEIIKWNRRIEHITVYSLLCIFTTAVVTIIFLYYLFR